MPARPLIIEGSIKSAPDISGTDTDGEAGAEQAPSQPGLPDMLGAFMQPLALQEQNESMQSCFSELESLARLSLSNACYFTGLISADFPANVLENTGTPETGNYLLSLQSERNWWPVAIVHLQENLAIAFIQHGQLETQAFYYVGSAFLVLLQERLAMITGIDPIMFSIRLTVTVQRTPSFIAISVDLPESDEEEEEHSDSSDSGSDDDSVEVINTPNAQLLIDLALLTASNPSLNAGDSMALVAAHMHHYSPEKYAMPDHFIQQVGIDSTEGVLSATVENGVFIAMLDFSGDAPQSSATLLINTNGDFVFVLVICNKPDCHGDFYSVVKVSGNCRQWETAMRGMVPNCGSHCRVSLYKKQKKE